jgi:REP element-mobilizing transposase RayT
MGRKPTILYDGAIYHVIQRGNNRAFIYNDQLDKAQFCDLLTETMAIEGYKFSLLYYVLMDNHFHLVVETPVSAIDRIMHRVNMMYTRYFNRKYGRSGSLYEGRYNGSLIHDTRHLMTVIRYIAYNPVRANLVKAPADYRWCAHLDVVSMKKGLVDVDGLLSKFSDDPHQARASYEALILSEVEVRGTKTIGQAKAMNKKEQKRMASLEIMLNSEFKDQTIRDRIVRNDKALAISAQRAKFAERAFLAGFYVKEIAALLNMSTRGVRYMLEGTKVKLDDRGWQGMGGD